MSAPRLLHVFSTFAPGGPQVRTARILTGLGGEFRHSILAMDGVLEARARVPPELEVRYLEAPRKAGSIATARRMRALLARERPDLVLTYNFGAIDTALAARSLSGLRLVHHEDGFLPDEAERFKRRRVWLRRLALPAAWRVVVVSENLRRIAREAWRLSEARLTLIPNGVDLERFAPGRLPWRNPPLRRALGISEPAFVVGAVGRLQPEKNFARLLAAVARLGGDAHLLLLGEGPELDGLRSQAERLGILPRVRFEGYRADPREHYAAMDAFALSSDTEQMPIALLEAMASGLCVAATDVGDVRAVLPEEQRSFVVPVEGEAATALAGALARLAADPGLRERLGRACRREAEARFDERRMLAAYRDLYVAALASKG